MSLLDFNVSVQGLSKRNYYRLGVEGYFDVFGPKRVLRIHIGIIFVDIEIAIGGQNA